MSVNSRLTLAAFAAENRSGHWRQADRWPTHVCPVGCGAAIGKQEDPVDGVAMQSVVAFFCHFATRQPLNFVLFFPPPLCTHSFKLFKKQNFRPAPPELIRKMNKLFILFRQRCFSANSKHFYQHLRLHLYRLDKLKLF